jgi:hypothetical protein
MEERVGSMLGAAASAGDLVLLKYMSLAFKSARREKYHEKALWAAILAGRLESVKMLLGSGVDPKAPRCIQTAQYLGHEAILAELLKDEYQVSTSKISA